MGNNGPGKITADAEIDGLLQASGRSCGTCTMCCKILGVDDPPHITKPPDTKCKFCMPGKGCTVYEPRPTPCRNFFCHWLIDPSLGDEWYPVKSRIVMYPADDAEAFIFELDPGRSDCWLREPYFTVISNTALQFRATTVRVGRRWYCMFAREAAERPESITLKWGHMNPACCRARLGTPSNRL